MIQCNVCEKNMRWAHDEYTHFGCSSYDPPEPLDPVYMCKKCSKDLKKDFIRKFNEGYRNGDWQKSNAEREAAEECGLKWVGSGGKGVLSTRYFVNAYQYIDKDRYDRLDALPYWGWCEKCAGENYGAVCRLCYHKVNR